MVCCGVSHCGGLLCVTAMVFVVCCGMLCCFVVSFDVLWSVVACRGVL